MTDIIALDAWLKAQSDVFGTKKKLLVFTDIIHKPTGERVREGFRYFRSSIDELVAAFDADDIESIASLEYALDEDDDPDTSGVCLLLGYTPDGDFFAAQPQVYIDYVPTLVREPKYLTVPAALRALAESVDQTRKA